MNNALPVFSFLDLQQHSVKLSDAYLNEGVIHLRYFLNEEKINQILSELEQAQSSAEDDLARHWNNQKLTFYSKNPCLSVDSKADYVTHPYFLSSADKTHIFYEDNNGSAKLNRIGHGLHFSESNPMIQSIIYNNYGLNSLLQMAKMQRPICQLSVYIPKFPNGVGSEVRPHQESTFAHTVPQTATVLWIALEDATIENACMWGIRGSHRLPLKFVSRVDHLKKTRLFEKLNDFTVPNFDPENKEFMPLEIKAGDALFFHGNYFHCSPVNNSAQSRKALSFQFIDTLDCTYSQTNWIQPRNNRYLYGSG
jgi:phytanoyl-CoA hydroxylase